MPEVELEIGQIWVYKDEVWRLIRFDGMTWWAENRRPFHHGCTITTENMPDGWQLMNYKCQCGAYLDWPLSDYLCKECCIDHA